MSDNPPPTRPEGPIPFTSPENLPILSAVEEETYRWQSWVPGMHPHGQQRLKAARVLVSRIGGLGGSAAYELAAAGVGRLVLAHAGDIVRSDLNRQLLMTADAVGTPRIESAVRRLRELNPHIDVVPIAQNITSANADVLVREVDVVVCCAPMFEERLAMNQACVRFGKVMIDCAMYDLTGQITVIRPHRTACLACRVPDPPAEWKRQFPVFGAVSGAIGAMGAMEAIKLITGIGETLDDRLLILDLRTWRIRTIRTHRRTECAVCGAGPS